MFRIGFLGPNSGDMAWHLFAVFRQVLREHGWVEGRNVVIEVRFADGKVDRLPVLVAELIQLKVDVIVAGASVATWAAKEATKTIPIVMAASANALGEGLVTSLAHQAGISPG